MFYRIRIALCDISIWLSSVVAVRSIGHDDDDGGVWAALRFSKRISCFGLFHLDEAKDEKCY